MADGQNTMMLWMLISPPSSPLLIHVAYIRGVGLQRERTGTADLRTQLEVEAGVHSEIQRVHLQL